jgi:hypothetical protein
MVLFGTIFFARAGHPLEDAGVELVGPEPVD